MKNQPKRHGDVNLHPTTEKIIGKKINHIGQFILALGETTGHKHVLTVPNIEDMEIYETQYGERIFVLHSEGLLTHEEHKPIIILPGTYKQVMERERDWFELTNRQVID